MGPATTESGVRCRKGLQGCDDGGIEGTEFGYRATWCARAAEHGGYVSAKQKRLPRQRKMKAERLDGLARTYLFTGHYFFGPIDYEGMHSLWIQHREELMNWWLSDPETHEEEGRRPTGPGTRPWAWYKWDAPAPLKGLETDYAYLARHGLFTQAEREYFARFPRVTPKDWIRLQSEGWHTRKGRELWLLHHQNLTRKGERWRRDILAYWHKLGLEQDESTVRDTAILDEQVVGDEIGDDDD
jgi:hypothetical protein